MRLLRSGGTASSDIVLPMPFFSGFPGEVRQMPAHEMLIPAEKGFEQDVKSRLVDLVVAEGVVVDVGENRFLDGICPGSITHATLDAGRLLVSRKEVLGPFEGQGRTIGFKYSEAEIVSLVDVVGEPSTVLHFNGRVRALAITPGSGQLIVVRETSIRRRLGGWLRTVSGHPQQASRYDIGIFVLKGRQSRVATANGLSTDALPQ